MSRTLKLTLKCYRKNKNQRHKGKNKKEAQAGGGVTRTTRLELPLPDKATNHPLTSIVYDGAGFQSHKRDRSGQLQSLLRLRNRAQPDTRDIKHEDN